MAENDPSHHQKFITLTSMITLTLMAITFFFSSGMSVNDLG